MVLAIINHFTFESNPPPGMARREYTIGLKLHLYDDAKQMGPV